VRMLLVTFIICREIFKNPDFHEWFTKNTVNAVMVSSLSLIHIECLKLLDARVAGFGNLNAPFSKVAEGFILWGVMCTIFVCDLPQLAVIYRSSVKNYDIIPFLTLIMGVITIFQNIMILIFNLMNSLSKDSQLKDGKSRSIGNASSNIQQRPEIKAHRSSIAMGPIENEIEYYEDDELKDAFSRRAKSWHCAESRERKSKSWDQLIRNSREFNNERDSAIIKKIEKEKRVSIIENRNTFVEEKGIIINIGNIDDSENNTVKDDDNTCTSIMVEKNTKINN
ncbi:15335_t:CDS:2, partial [Dentiscutata heterogama]